MRYQVSRRVVLLVPLGAVLLGAGVATGSYAAPVTSTYSYFPLLGSRDVFPAAGEQYAAVVTANFTMKPGETRRVTDQLDISIPSGHSPEVNNRIMCFDQTGQEIGRASTGTNYTGDGHAYQWNVSTLITAPAQNPAENYLCELQTYVNDSDTGYHMSVLAPTPGETTYGTWLEVSSADEAGAQMWLSDHCDPSDSTDTCSYIGGPARLGNPAAIDVFSPPADVWTAADDATSIDAVATMQITTCTSGTSSCKASEHGDSGVYDGQGESYLDVDQLYPNGSVCQVNQAYSEESTGGQVLLSERYDISDAQHHRPLFYHVSAPVSQTCEGSRKFAVDLHIQWTGGNGVKIDGGNVNVINIVGQATVPAVVGDTAVKAGQVIRNAGLTVSASSVNSCVDPGTVRSQDPAAGTQVALNSQVDIQISVCTNGGQPK